MPHMHISSFKDATYPFECDGVEFLFKASSIDNENSLVATRYKNKEFFINLKNGAKKLIKADKTTRPNPNHLLKHSMSAYASSLGLDILDSNIDSGGENIHLVRPRGLRTIEDFSSFIDAKNISIEVGFGSGRHLLHQAKSNPDMVFIGLEIHKPSIEQVLKQIEIQNLDNLLVLDYDARLFLELIPSNRIDKIYVHFPVPWDKKPHRRVISLDFLREADRVLKVGGNLELRSDSELYYRYALEVFSTPAKSRFFVDKNQEIEISSKYEDRWKKMSKNIYDVVFTSLSEADERAQIDDFVFDKEIDSKNLSRLPHGSIVRDWGFVRIERIYRIDDNRGLIRVAMGGFDRPENIYVLIERGCSRYYPSAPIKSSTNQKAHNLLNEILNG